MCHNIDKYIIVLGTELRKPRERGNINSPSVKARKAEVGQWMRPLEAIKQLEKAVSEIQMLRPAYCLDMTNNTTRSVLQTEDPTIRPLNY